MSVVPYEYDYVGPLHIFIMAMKLLNAALGPFSHASAKTGAICVK